MEVLEFGAVKYGVDNWSNCAEPVRYYDAAMRHLMAVRGGEMIDIESGKHHIAHAICSLMFLYELMTKEER